MTDFETPSAEEIAVSMREHPDVARAVLELAIGIARERGGGTIPVGSYDIQAARDHAAASTSENAELRAELAAVKAELAAVRAAARHPASSSTPSIPDTGARQHEPVKAPEYAWPDQRRGCSTAEVLGRDVRNRRPAGDRAGRRPRVHVPMTARIPDTLNLENALG
jgi:hypothetical protein